MITFNIGSAIGATDKALSIATVVNELSIYDLEPTAFRTELSGTETTYIIRCPFPAGFNRVQVDAMVHDIAANLQQEAIAYTVLREVPGENQYGYQSLVGPLAHTWNGGEFDASQFLPW